MIFLVGMSNLFQAEVHAIEICAKEDIKKKIQFQGKYAYILSVQTKSTAKGIPPTSINILEANNSVVLICV